MFLSLSKRDLMVAAIAITLTGSAFALAGSATEILGPTTFPWDAMTVHRSPVGETRQVIKQPTATLEQLEVHITTLNAGQASHPPHHHPNEELILLDKGTVETLSKGKWVRLGPGSVIFNAAESWHSLRSVGDGPAQYFVVNWRTPATDAIARTNGQTE